MSESLSPTKMANAIRALAMDAVEKAKSGHPGMPMGAADMATALFTQVMNFDAGHPSWPNRDRFVLSAGHGSMLQYALLYLLGYPGMEIENLKQFRQLGSNTAGHPEYGHTVGVETTTGPLGQGIATAVGMAMAEEMLAARFSREVVDHYTYVIAGDGDLMEGISQESISLAGHLKLNRLVVLWDDNEISIDGAVSLSESGDTLKRFEAAGWHAVRVDGHDIQAVATALEAARKADKPSLIACRTVIGFGAPSKAGKSSSHGSPLGAEEIAGARKSLGWEAAPFEIPADILSAWRAAGSRGAQKRLAWEKAYQALPADVRKAFDAAIKGDVSAEVKTAIAAHKQKLYADKPNVATRKASEMALEVINAAVSQTVGGSADLTGSNNTLTKGLGIFSAQNRAGRYVHYGIREHGMAAAMNGMALHGGVIPYSGTFLVFSDYCRPAIRLSALMGQRVIYVMTHDSIGLGEDGPTHQPVEHLASLRAMPNVLVFRPADVVETAECWELALCEQTAPSIMALSRQNLPTVRTEGAVENRCAQGAYELRAASRSADVSIFATGSEVMLAVEAQEKLESQGIATRVVSVPCFELFERLPQKQQAAVLGTAKVNIAVEAAIKMGWERFIGNEGIFVGMNSFGASAPAEKLYVHFGITAEHVVAQAVSALSPASAKKKKA